MTSIMPLLLIYLGEQFTKQFHYERACYARARLQEGKKVILLSPDSLRNVKETNITWIWFSFTQHYTVYASELNGKEEKVTWTYPHFFIVEGESRLSLRLWCFFFCLRYPFLWVKYWLLKKTN